MTIKCPECGQSFESIGNHWQYKNHRPDFSNKQTQIIRGILMGDGWLDRRNNNWSLLLDNKQEDYLDYLDEEFGVLSSGVRDLSHKNGIWRWSTRHHPEIKNFDWYRTGSKVWPHSIELSPIVLKHWYVCDGEWDTSGTSNRIRIAMANESENTEKVSDIFSNSGLPQPTYGKYGENCVARFSVEESKTLWKYMGEPIPGFEYKWPDEYKS